MQFCAEKKRVIAAKSLGTLQVAWPEAGSLPSFVPRIPDLTCEMVLFASSASYLAPTTEHGMQ
jgi:hypothetical protein